MDGTSQVAADNAADAIVPAGPRSFPNDFPTLKHCRDGPTLAAAIAGAAASLRSIDLQPGVCMCCGGAHTAAKAQWLCFEVTGGVMGRSDAFSLQDIKGLAAAIQRCSHLTELNLSSTSSSPAIVITNINKQPHFGTPVLYLSALGETATQLCGGHAACFAAACCCWCLSARDIRELFAR